ALCITTKLVSRHLNLLGFNLNLDGSRFLIAAINLYAEQPDQRLHKELYPAIQKLCNATNATCVEHSIRTSIRSAWQKRDLSVWSQYFPQTVDEKCPSNKTFISCVAEITRKRDWL
ncbi:MAG: hypothetical protein IKK11_04680, partial [Oscillospiraceae bacterium]|nr:hypothetical protein [Oscillospiraceae bacterium]